MESATGTVGPWERLKNQLNRYFLCFLPFQTTCFDCFNSFTACTKASKINFDLMAMMQIEADASLNIGEFTRVQSHASPYIEASQYSEGGGAASK